MCSTMFEEKYADYHRLIKPGFVFASDHTLIRHISKRFNDGFLDNRVENKAIKDWINKGPPIVVLLTATPLNCQSKPSIHLKLTVK